MIEEAVNSLLRTVINAIIDVSGFAIRANQQNAPRPTGAYADVNLISDVNVGWERSKFTNRDDGDLDQSIKGFRNLTYNLGFYRDNAIDNCRLVRTALNRETIQDLFRAANVGVGFRSQVRNIPQTLEDTWEERAQFDLTVNIIGEDADIVTTIESVIIDYESQQCGNTYISTIEVNT